ncbi:MAG TPA: flagellar basal body rod protein FlgB [Rectinemataceae bacterium]|nr:flagellar basal body rod protein FlgB [Rectinemataceae bacterium]
MFEGTSFGRTVDLLQRSMDVATLRRQVIADNIANADVPNFKRSVINFESSLKQALESTQDRPALMLATDNPRHISNYQPVDYRTVQPRRVLDYMTTSKNNGNNVDPEEELMASVQNQLMYTLQAQAVSYEFGQVNLVLR